MAGKEIGHLFLHTLLWWTKEYGDERGHNPATFLVVNQLLGDNTLEMEQWWFAQQKPGTAPMRGHSRFC